MAEDGPPRGDGAVYAFFDMVALAFAFEGTAALLKEGLVAEVPRAYATSVALFLFGVKWPTLKTYFGPRLSTTVENVATDFRYWLLVLLVAFVYLGLPLWRPNRGGTAPPSDRTTEAAPEPKAQAAAPPPSSSPAVVEVRPGTILATHYPSGELFAVDPASGNLSLLSANLGEPSAVLVRPNGKLIVLNAEWGVVTEVDPKGGRHRDIAMAGAWGGPKRGAGPMLLRGTAMAFESESSVLVAAGDYIVRVNLDGNASDPDAEIVTRLEGAQHIGGLVFEPPATVLISDTTGGRIVEKNLTTGEQRVLREEKYPYALLRLPSGELLVGAHRDGKGALLRIARDGSKESVVAVGPFVTIAGIALESDGSVLVADNGEGSPGNGFIARIRADNSAVEMLLNAQTSGWKFRNGRGIAVVPAPLASTSGPGYALVDGGGRITAQRNFSQYGLTVERYTEHAADGGAWPAYRLRFKREPEHFEVRTDSGATPERDAESAGQYRVIFIDPGFGNPIIEASFKIEAF